MPRLPLLSEGSTSGGIRGRYTEGHGASSVPPALDLLSILPAPGYLVVTAGRRLCDRNMKLG